LIRSGPFGPAPGRCRCGVKGHMVGSASSALPSQNARKIRAVHPRRHGYEFFGKRVQTRAPDDSTPAPPTGHRMSLNPGYQERIRQAIRTLRFLDVIQGSAGSRPERLMPATNLQRYVPAHTVEQSRRSAPAVAVARPLPPSSATPPAVEHVPVADAALMEKH
jgi:hypothetical protein